MNNYELLDKFYDLYWKYNTEEKTDENLNKLKQISKEIPELKNWPEDKETFWNVESHFWELRFKKGERNFIKKTIHEQISDKHIDIASGSLPINHKCVCIDISQNMLNNIKTDQQKVKVNLEEPLPFKDNEFTSATCIFILNYIQNLDQLLQEIYRILEDNGKLIIVQSNKPLSSFYKTMEKNNQDIILESLEKNNFYTTIENHEFNGKEILIIIAKI